MKNKYIIRSRISEKKFREILRLFSVDIEASKVSLLSGVSRPTINRTFAKIRECIAEEETELDESYFGVKRVRGLRGRGAKGKIPVFGMLKQEGKVSHKSLKTAPCQG